MEALSELERTAFTASYANKPQSHASTVPEEVLLKFLTPILKEYPYNGYRCALECSIHCISLIRRRFIHHTFRSVYGVNVGKNRIRKMMKVWNIFIVLHPHCCCAFLHIFWCGGGCGVVWCVM